MSRLLSLKFPLTSRKMQLALIRRGSICGENFSRLENENENENENEKAMKRNLEITEDLKMKERKMKIKIKTA